MQEIPGTAHLQMQHDFRDYDSSDIWKLLKDSIHLQYSRTNEALAFFENILLHSRKINYRMGTGSALYAMGNIYDNKGMYTHASKFFHSAAATFREHKMEKLLGQVYNNLANTYKIQGRIQQSAYYYYLSLKTAYNSQDSTTIPHIYYNLSILLHYSEQGIYYLERAEMLARHYGQHHLQGLILIAKTRMRTDRQEWTQAEALIDETALLAQEHDLPDILYGAYLQYANLWLLKEKPENALRYLEDAKKILDQLLTDNQQEHFGLSNWYGLMGTTLFNMDYYHEAKPYLIKAMEIATRLNIKHQMAEAHKLLSHVYEHTGDYAKALTHQRTYQELKDSVLNESITRNVSDLEIKYRTAEKDREIARKEQEIEQRNVLIGGITLGGILLLAGSVAYYRHIRQKQKLLQQEQELIQLKALMKGEEIERTRIARELHDGVMINFSSVKMNLGAIMKRFPETEQTTAIDEVARQLDDATKELRKSAHNLMPDMLLREGLVAAVQYFCGSISRHAGPEIAFQQYGTAQPMLPEYELMLYRIIQELLQNALKYAEATRIIVQLDYTESLFTITVEDNGKGFDTENPVHTNGSGLNSIRSRVEATGGNIEIQSGKNTGTTVYIELETVTLQSG